MSGFYNYHPKVEHPNSVFLQMQSDGGKPFYFGGSQVPFVLGTEHHHVEKKRKVDNMEGVVEGTGLKGYVSKSSRRVMPAHLKSLDH